ncbi:MAG: thioredoxin family protein [Pseudomonadota bacterium]
MRPLLLLLFLAWAPAASAAELVMVEETWCEWCERWNEEIGIVYHKTAEGKRAPLRRIDIHGAQPTDLTFDSRPRYTPTFILVENGQEVGRIEGYPGEDFFWGLLQRLLDKLPPDPATVSNG